MSGRPRRVPPPPPPGFGDEEYYRLYGEPEQYQRYRKDLESRVARSDAGEEEYYVYRRVSSQQQFYNHHPPHSERKRRIAPPPPPGFGDSPPVRKRLAPPRPHSWSSGSEGDCGPAVFRNIKVTIKNDSDGTPSLSESEDDRRRGKKKKRKKEKEKEKRKRLEKKLAKREQELKLLSEQQKHLLTVKEQGGRTDPPKKSIKERLGVRKDDVPKVQSPVVSRLSPAVSSQEKSRRDELLRRAEIRRQNQEKSPIPYQGKKTPSSSSTKRRNRQRSSSSVRSRRRQSPSKSRDRGKASEGGSKPLERRRRKRRRRRRERGGLVKQMSLKEENEEMKAKLARRANKGKSGGKVEERLARLAGIRDNKESESDEYDSDTSSESDNEEKKKITGKMRSDEVKVETRGETVKTGDKWKHDKFDEAAGDSDEEEETKFSKHWSRSSSSRNKRRGRSRSQSRSRSRRRSRSRSKSRPSRKTRRRGKFSRSKSRSTSESSRSRSRSRRKSESYSSRSGSRGSSRSRSENSRGRSAEDGVKKEGVDLGLSGSLTADANTVNGTVVKYAEPTEAKKPKKKWRLYVFKGSEELPILYIHRQSAYLLGRDRKVADIPLDHPSCSKQHSVLQYRLVPVTREDGTTASRVQLYVMDLNSANGTFVNNKKIESQKYIQLLEKDVLKFGFSSREYVLLHDQSKEDEEDLGID